MLLRSLRALSKAPVGAGSIWKYLEALVRTTRVSGRFAYGFRTELHFADVSWTACLWIRYSGCHSRNQGAQCSPTHDGGPTGITNMIVTQNGICMLSNHKDVCR